MNLNIDLYVSSYSMRWLRKIILHVSRIAPLG